MRCAVVTFPGSNCDGDARLAIGEVLGVRADAVWHTEGDLARYDLIVLPGGFSYGDYLRCGAIARVSPVMHAVRARAAQGALVLGICNGFQVLTECGLLPGALVRNDHMQFRCEQVELVVENVHTPFTRGFAPGERLRIPIAHGDGNYVADADTLERMRDAGQVVLRYAGDNPNGSTDAIAGVCNERGNVLGMMPHPERAIADWMGSTDGARMLSSLVVQAVAAMA